MLLSTSKQILFGSYVSLLKTTIPLVSLFLFTTTLLSHSTEKSTHEVATKIDLTAQEKAWLKEHPVIKVGADPTWAPVEFIDSDKKFKGIAIEYINTISKLLDIKFSYVFSSTWQATYDKVKTGEVDILSCLSQTPERSLLLTFTRPYLDLPIVIFANKTSPYIGNLNELEGHKVAVGKSYAVEEWLYHDYPKLRLVPVDIPAEAFELLNKGEVTAFIDNMLTANYCLDKMGLLSIKIAGKTPYTYSLRMGVRKEIPHLKNILQKALNSIPESERVSIYRKWIAHRQEPPINYSLFLKFLVPIALIVMFVTYWNHKLAQEVRRRRIAETELRRINKELDNRVLQRTRALQKASEEKERIELQLRHSQKMEALGSLAGGIAHDFNNIIGGILGFAELTQKRLPDASPLRLNIDQILLATKRASQLVKQILTFSRQVENEMNPVEIHLIINEALKLLRASIPSTIKIKNNVRKQPDVVLADPSQIHQVIMNLCANASHAMEDTGGILTVSLERHTFTHENLDDDMPSLAPGDYAVLKVQDTGHGISPENLERIFDPYFTTKEHEKGTGLGLAVVHGIVKSHNGYITVSSAEGKGTTFTIYFPTIIETTPIPPQEPPPPQAPNSKSVLVVDDDQLHLTMLSKMLKDLGYIVTSTNSSRDAHDLFQKTPDTFDAVVTDLTMPEMTGLELAKSILKKRPRLPIIVLTGFLKKPDEIKLQQVGVKTLLMKPVTTHDMGTALHDALNKV